MIVEWSSADRSRLEALARDGVIAVRYKGCEVQILGQCHGPGGYRYTPTTLKHDAEKIRTADELYAKMPFGAAKLEGTLETRGELSVSMTIVGRYSAERSSVRAADLQGNCAEATHVIVGLAVGAFEFSTKAKSKAGASGSVFDYGGGVETAEQRDVLSRDGDEASCKNSSGADGGPPEGCRALLRVELVPLPELEARLAAEEKARREAEEDARTSAARGRAWGYGLTGVGVGAGLAAAGFAFFGSKTNDDIRAGGFATSDDIKEAEARGRTYNSMTIGLGIAAGALIGVGVPLILTHPAPKPALPSVGLGIGPVAGGGILSIEFR